MYRFYVLLATLIVSLFSYAQYQNWSLFDDMQREAARGATRGTGSHSGHK